MRDVFVPDLDDADTGIQGRIMNMQDLLAKHDPEVKEHLEEMGIDASFYAIRWWTTLLSREFLLPDVIRLWDSMFASTRKDNFLRYVCVTMVLLIRSDLLKGDFSTCLRLLQSYPSTSMDLLLDSSRALWIYESQVTVACHRGGLSLHQAVQTITPPDSLIMAFGLRNKNGSLVSLDDNPASMSWPSAPSREQIEMAKARTAEKMRGAKKAVSASATGLFGRARGLYSKYSSEYAKRRNNNGGFSTDGLSRSTSDSVVPVGQAPEDSSNIRRSGSEDVNDLATKLESSAILPSGGTSTSGQIAVLPIDRPEDDIYLAAFSRESSGETV